MSVLYNKFNQTVEDWANKVHNLGSDALKILLTNVAPAAANEVKADLTEIAGGGTTGYTAGGVAVTVTQSSQTGGTYKLVGSVASPTWTAGADTLGPPRYAVLYNDTPTSPADPLIGYWDYGTPLTIPDGATFTITLDASNGILQIA